MHVHPLADTKQCFLRSRTSHEHLVPRITIASHNLVLAKYSGITTSPLPEWATKREKEIVYSASTGLRLLLALLTLRGPQNHTASLKTSTIIKCQRNNCKPKLNYVKTAAVHNYTGFPFLYAPYAAEASQGELSRAVDWSTAAAGATTCVRQTGAAAPLESILVQCSPATVICNEWTTR